MVENRFNKLTFKQLEELYSVYNKRKYVHPDPLEFLYNYKNKKDQEVVGLIASLLAYGRVAQILKSVSIVLDKMGKSPKSYLESTSPQKIKKDFKGFKHRFTTDEELSLFLVGIKKVLAKYGSLQRLFKSGVNKKDENILNSLENFVNEIKKSANIEKSSLLSDPSKGSACKRLHLYLRWMIRSDDVDPGCWKGVSLSKLIIPLDTHMFQIAKMFRLTSSKQANLKAAIEITESFEKLNRGDPIKYDFVLTRFGIRSEMNKKDIIKHCGG